MRDFASITSGGHGFIRAVKLKINSALVADASDAKARPITTVERHEWNSCPSQFGVKISHSDDNRFFIFSKHFAQGIGDFTYRRVSLDRAQNLRHQIRSRSGGFFH